MKTKIMEKKALERETERELAKIRESARFQCEAAESKAKKECEEKEKLQAEKDAIEAKQKAEKKSRLDAEKKALKAPDKEKLLNLVVQIEAIKTPELNSEEAKELMIKIQNSIHILIDYIKKQSENL